MKRKMNIAFALLLSASVLASGCSGNKEAAQPTAPSEEPAQTPEATETVLIQVNTYGLGNIATTDDGTEPEFGEYPIQSSVMNTAPGTEIKMAAKADTEEGYVFVKWTKNGEFYSTDEKISVKADADAEYIAVFMMTTGYEGEPVKDVKDAKVLGDVLGLPTGGSSFGEDYYAFGFELNNVTYQALADLDAKTSQELFDLDSDDPEYNKKHNEKIAPIAIKEIINITEKIPTEKELEAYKGKTLGELMDAGWSNSGWDLEENIAYMTHEYFAFNAAFEGTWEGEFDEDTLAKMTVKSMTYAGIDDPAYTAE